MTNKPTHIDHQGFKIKVGAAYFFVFAMPGPDISCLVVESINEDGTVNGYDVLFKKNRAGDVRPHELWRPIKHTWSAWPQEAKAVTDYVGAQALDLTP